MKKYLTVLLATIALPVFGSAYPNGVTQMGDPYAGRIYLGLDPIVQVNEGARTQEVFLTYESVLPGIVNLNWTSFTNLDPGIPNTYVEYGVFRAPHGTRVPNTQTDNEGVASSYTPAQLSTNIPPWEWVSTTGPAYGGGLLANTFQLTDVNASTQTDYWIYPIIQVGNPLTNFSDATYPMSSNYNVICIGCQTANTNPGTLVWVTNSTVYESASRSIAFSVALDSTNNVYICGYHFGTNYIGTNVLSSVNSLDQAAFIAKLDSNGRPLWTRTLHEYPLTAFAVKCTGITCDRSGNVIVCGLFAGTVNFGSGNVTSTGGTADSSADMFVAKYDPNNNLLWLKTPTGGLYDSADAITVDTNDDVLVVGHFMSNTGSGGALDWGGGHILSNIGVFNIAVAKLSKTNGSCLWASQIGNAGTSTSYAISTDKNGNAFAIGGFYNGNVVKFNSAGVFQWANGDTSLAYSGAADTNGNVIIQSKVGINLYLKGYSSAGSPMWSYQNYDNNTVNTGYGVAVNTNNLLAIVGGDVTGIYFTGLDNWRGIAMGNGQQNQYISMYSLSGTNPPTPIWLNQLGFGCDGALSQALGVAFDSSGNVVVCGNWLNPLDFGGWTVTPSTSQSTPAKRIDTYSPADYLLYVAKYRK